MSPNQLPEAIVLFDGVCSLCSRLVVFVVERDRTGTIRFASLQSAAGAALLKEHGVPPSVDSLILIHHGRAYLESSAALRIAGLLRWPWPVLAVLRVIPRPFRDWLYRLIARRRYRWFGRLDSCRLPLPQWRDRFL